MSFSRGSVPLKTPAKLLPFFLIGVILLRNYHSGAEKYGFRVAEMAKIMAKKSDFPAFYWQNADSFAEMVANSQVIICYFTGVYSNT